MKRLRRVTEAEVIAEFLKNEFYQGEFHRDRHRFEHLVLDADLTSEHENMLRRALLFRRRGHMWRELPADTQWWQMQFEPEDMRNLRVFPRAQWRKIAGGSFALDNIVDRIRNGEFSGKVADFISKIHSLSYQMRVWRDCSSVILIGENESSTVTIIEGNHRLTAAMLGIGGPEAIGSHFRIFLGVSPHMNEVCWHNGNFKNMARYIKNRLKHLWHDEDADLNRIPVSPDLITARTYAKVGEKVMRESK